jgi:NAD-dependent dihydropyrimidine dehydrogenase PreA subunit
MCQHCQKPPCAAGAPEGAVYIRDDGIVILDPEKSKGRSDIAEKCPYGAVSWNEETGLSQKCNMCAHMLDSGEKTTRCAESCPTKALYFGDLDDPESEIAKYVAMRGDFTRLMPELGSEPAVLYRELPAPFITGEVLLADKPDECCPGAVVRCAAKDGTIQETVTDFLGDFQFKGLKKGGEYIVTAAFPGYKTHEQKLTVDKASDLRIVLEK